jgi:hypothetical protein
VKTADFISKSLIVARQTAKIGHFRCREKGPMNGKYSFYYQLVAAVSGRVLRVRHCTYLCVFRAQVGLSEFGR